MVVFSAVALAQPKTFSIPFRNVGNYILVDVQVDHKRTVLLFDTGAVISVVTISKSHTYRKLILDKHKDGTVSFISADDVEIAFVSPNVSVDGFFGQDLMRRFSSIRIDYGRHVVEMTE